MIQKATGKEKLEFSLCVILCLAVLTFTFWHGMNKELCNRNYSTAEYAEMELDCK